MLKDSFLEPYTFIFFCDEPTDLACRVKCPRNRHTRALFVYSIFKSVMSFVCSTPSSSALLLCFPFQEKVSADEQKVKLKAKDRREIEVAEERVRKQNEEYSRASAGEKDAATLVSSNHVDTKPLGKRLGRAEKQHGVAVFESDCWEDRGWP